MATRPRVTDLNALDEVRWFSDLMKRPPTCRAVAEHARDIYEVDFRFPIILSPSGVVLDGMHRLCIVNSKDHGFTMSMTYSISPMSIATRAASGALPATC